MKKLFLAVVLILVPANTFAIDVGTASGGLTVDGQRIDFHHAYTNLHMKEMRVLLTDKEVRQRLLFGVDYIEKINQAVDQGEASGLLIVFNPEKPSARAACTVLIKKTGLKNKPRTFKAKGVKNFRTGQNRVAGEIEWKRLQLYVKFDAPLFKEK
jgi:hypothetical protein